MILIFGSINVDLVARVQTIARPGQTVLAAGYERFFGGKGANQAVAAARALKSDALPIAFCGAVGEDRFAAECIANLSAEGIDVAGIRTVPGGTGCAFISVDASGENAITVASGSNLEVRADRLEAAVLSTISVVVLQMEVPWEENAALAARARASGALVILNFAPARTDIPLAGLRHLLSDIDVLVVNEHEADALTGALFGTRDVNQQLADEWSFALIVTSGAAGIRLFRPGEIDWHCPAMEVEVVDTTGAGDVFVGVLASGLSEKLPMRQAVERAGCAASLSCTKPGAQAGAPKRREIEEAMMRYASTASSRSS